MCGLRQAVHIQLLVEEGNGKPPLLICISQVYDVTSEMTKSSRTCLMAELIIIIIIIIRILCKSTQAYSKTERRKEACNKVVGSCGFLSKLKLVNQTWYNTL